MFMLHGMKSKAKENVISVSEAKSSIYESITEERKDINAKFAA